MHNLLTRTADELRAFLNDALPTIAPDNWWQDCVISKLSFQQQRIARERNAQTLSNLDLSALLRVFDQNWHELAHRRCLPAELRNWLKELQSVRNRWAHMDGNPASEDDRYRDLDTLQRFLRGIAASEAVLESIAQSKADVRNTPVARRAVLQSSQPVPVAHVTEYAPGQLVALRSNTSVTGAVLQVLQASPENRYLVFVNGQTTSYYASQLQPTETAKSAPTAVDVEAFHCSLSALQLREPSLSHLYSLHAARVTYVPYQFRPVLKFIRADRPRLLIADEVGVGKTIEAGLILRECQARRDVRNVLIICPKALVAERKWQLEMKRFDEEFTQLDGPMLRYCLEETHLSGGVWPAQHSKTILPFSLCDEGLLHGFRKIPGLLALDPPPRFDLVIVDEAHHARNTDTWVHRAVSFFCEHAEAVVFLSATPVQLGSHELFTLLRLLRPDLVLDWESFCHMAEPNRFLFDAISQARTAAPGWESRTAAALSEAADTAWGKALIREQPEFQELYDRLVNQEFSAGDRIACISKIESFNTFSALINRTRRRDIGNFATRQPETISVPFTEGQQMLHDALIEAQRSILSLVHEKGVAFMMTTLRRQAASCLFGLAPILRDLLNRRLEVLEFAEVESELPDVAPQVLEKVRVAVAKVLALASDLPPEDPKLDAFLRVVLDKQAQPNNKLLVFTSFRHTLSYLESKLENVSLRVAVIHGGIPDHLRAEIRRRFWLARDNSEAIDLLLCSEVGSEGLDYQCCDGLVNYDLPWNPARVEQRIGRIDRHGQASPVVAIWNLITPGTVDADIYERCLVRIGVFRQALGGSEEILGRLTSELRHVCESLALSPEERAARLQQLADNEVRAMQEEAALEEKELELIGLRLPPRELDADVADTASFWLSPDRLRALVGRYLRQVVGSDATPLLGDGELQTIRLGQESRRRLLEGHRALPKRVSVAAREWEQWLKGGEPHLPVTFDQTTAAAQRSLAFITPVHPLAQQAAAALEPTAPIHTSADVTTDMVAPGEYPFAVYQWRRQGGREDTVLQPVCTHPEVAAHIIPLLSIACGPAAMKKQIDNDTVEWLEARHHELWSEAKAAHSESCRQRALAQRESLTASHTARLRLLEEQLAMAENEKIRRMRESQLATARADYSRRLFELEAMENRADIASRAVAYGILKVNPANSR